MDDREDAAEDDRQLEADGDLELDEQQAEEVRGGLGLGAPTSDGARPSPAADG